MPASDAWRELQEHRFPELTLDCGEAVNPGVIYSDDLRDWSNKPFFDRGLNLGVHKNQDTLSLGLLAFFGPKR